MRLLLALTLAATLGGCATTRDGAARDPRDPWEGFNRGVWGFNQAVDRAAIRPVTQVYRAVTPPPARRGIGRVFANLLEPLNVINNLLQGKPGRAINSLGRFVVNSTIGVAGLADHATDLGLPNTSEDFGQTLAVWGLRKSPYLVLPILGPSTARDGVGTAVQFAVDPTQIALDEEGASGTIKTAATVTRVINLRSDVIDSGFEAVLESSADPYATARETFFQRREAQIADETATVNDAEDEQRLLDDAIRDASPEDDSGINPMTEEPGAAPKVDPKDLAATPRSDASPQLSLVFVDDQQIAY